MEFGELFDDASAPMFEAIARHNQLLGTYLDSLDPAEYDHAQRQSTLIDRQGGALHPFVAIIPVAAHQESPETLLGTLYQYSKQRAHAPFSVVLGLNYPESERDNPAIALTQTAVQHGKDFFPTLDIRAVTSVYNQPRIGQIRRDAWNAVTYNAHHHASKEWISETIGLNHDIDMTHMSPHFIAMLQQHYRKKFSQLHSNWNGAALEPAATRSNHAYDARYPNISRAAFWVDFVNRSMHGGHEAGTAIPLSYYASNGGFDPTARDGEVLSFIGKHYRIDIARNRFGAAAFTTTSLRRYIERLQDHSLTEIWTPGSFDASNTYRTTLPAGDISHERLDSLVSERVTDDVEECVLYDAKKVAAQGFLTEIRDRLPYRFAAQKLRLADRALRQVMLLPDAANWISYRFQRAPESIQETADKRVARFYRDLQ